MYESPIELIYGQIQTEIEDGLLLKCSQSVGYNIDKEELIKALKYDREQYVKGYANGLNADKWISVDERLPNTDERVLVYIPRPDNHYNIEIAYISEGNDDYPYWVLRDKSQFYSTRFYYISHWQPLPEPPQD